MEDISKLVELGKDMDLKGAKLADFVDKREKNDKGSGKRET